MASGTRSDRLPAVRPASRLDGAGSALGRCGSRFALLERHLALFRPFRLADRPRPLELIPEPATLFGLETATPHPPFLAHAHAPPGIGSSPMVLLRDPERKRW